MSRSESVFVDSSGWIALLNRDDRFHAEANSLAEQVLQSRRLLITTDWIIAESGNSLSRSSARASFVAVARELFVGGAPARRLITIDESLRLHALQIYESHQDKFWGLVDCSSFAVMRQLSLTDAFAHDRHFTQAGFHCLL